VKRGFDFSSTDLNGEAEVARRAVDKIREWLKEQREARGKRFIPRLAVKFCGGCNPVLDRGHVARGIRDSLGADVYWVAWEEKADLALVVNGCLTACADQEEIRKKATSLLVIQGYDVSDIEARLGIGKETGG
jgi:hypothetical protein